MAATTTLERKPVPLDFMTKLSHAVYHLQSDTASTVMDAGSAQPKLILVLGWMDARDAHLAKYVLEYRARYPASTIILIKARLAIMTSQSTARSDVSAAVPIIRKTLSSSPTSKPELLIHAFSNGGSCLLSTLNASYRAQDGAASALLLPLHVTIFDSAPAMRYNRQQAMTAILVGIPKGLARLFAIPLLKLVSLFWWFQFNVLRFPDVLARIAAQHNHRRKVKETSRIYIYSDKDALVSSKEIEQHALQARQNGFNVTKELFAGSPHVAHAKTDAARYWKIVDKAWQSR